jgi:hypothetical protein
LQTEGITKLQCSLTETSRQTTINVNVELAGREWRPQTTISVASEPIGIEEMLPLFCSFADRLSVRRPTVSSKPEKKFLARKGAAHAAVIVLKTFWTC